MRKDKKTQAEIGRAIGVSQATVSKELKRNRCSNGHYSPRMPQVFADDAKQRSHKPRKLDAGMRAFIVEKIERFQWSPEQIKGYCDANGIGMVSVEWIYRLIRLLKPFKRHVLSITTDNGGEFARHKLVSKALNAPVFFADPYSSWQKGTVENTNKLIRQYIDKQMNISNLTYNNLLVIQNKLNYRSRKVLAFNHTAALFYNFAC